MRRIVAIGAQASVVFVDFDRAPECRYPVALEQAYAATAYVAEHAEAFGVDPARLAVAGESSGGNLATVVSLLAKQRSGPRIACQVLFYPTTNSDFETASYRQFADGPWLTRRAMQWFWDQYIPDHGKRESPYAVPLLASLDSLAGLPRTLIITAENDVLRDEGEAYGRRLIQAGVEVVTTRYNATIHDFVLLNALANSAPTRAALTQAVDFLKSVLTRKESRDLTSGKERRRPMRDEKQIQQLEAQIARDEQRYREILRLEEELMQNVPRRGFAAASTEGRYRTEKQSLDEAIFHNKVRLAAARSQ
jgi:acetyl esterase/lipase